MGSARRFLLILALTAMWSPSFLFIKLAIQDIPPLTTVTLRVTLAAIILLAILTWKRTSLPKMGTFWFHSTIMAFFSSVFPFYMFCFAEQTIPSALAAILNGTSPMFTAFLAHCFIPSDRLHLKKAIGISFGAVGLILLFLPNLMELFEDNAAPDTIGMIAAAVAAFSYAISHIYAKKYLTKQAPFVAPTAQIMLSSLMLIPFALWIDVPLSLPWPSLSAIMGVCGLAIFGTVTAFIIYYKLLDHCGPTAISMVACFFPAVGMLLGFLFLGESLSIENIAAASLILIGVMIVNEVITLPFLKTKTSTT